VSSKPSLLEPVRTNVRKWLAALATDGLPAGHSLLVLAVMDGVCFWKMFQMHSPSDADIATLKKILHSLASVEKAASQNGKPVRHPRTARLGAAKSKSL